MLDDGPLDLLIRQISSLPGLGNRSAKRIALHLLTNKEKIMSPLTKSLGYVSEIINPCQSCGNLDEGDICRICRNPKRNKEIICVVANVADLWAIERTSTFNGIYHILGGTLSALDGITPDDLNINSLIQNAKNGNISEIILALSATVDGQSTSHYIADQLRGSNISITRLAHGVPVGGELDYLDDNTISTALKARKKA